MMQLALAQSCLVDPYPRFLTRGRISHPKHAQTPPADAVYQIRIPVVKPNV
jgi:hypothetical protein